MDFKINIPYRESSNPGKKFHVDYQVKANDSEEAVKIAKNKFNNYENNTFASWERIMFEDEITISQLINNKVYVPEMLDEFYDEFTSLDESEKFFILKEISYRENDQKCNLYYDFLSEEQNSKVKSFIISLIGKHICVERHKELLPFLEDFDSRVRANTIETLEKFGLKELIPNFISMLADENNRVRANAIKALWNLGEQNIEDHINKMLTSNNTLMKSSALYVLGETNIPGSFDIILKYLVDEDELVRFNAGRSLYKIIKVEQLKELLPFLDEIDDIVKIYVKKCFLKFEDEATSVILKGIGIKLNTENSKTEAGNILREISIEKLKSGDRIGFFKLLLKRIWCFFK